MTNNTELLTIRQTARRGPLPEHRLRAMKAEGRLPGFSAGTRFYVNYGKLLDLIEKESTVG